ncbi:hypothetical protein [Humibacter albus]|uniref:hypothetical protein n=1 Tax=Humibacter albus TaxID=427754 RepID=UPI0003B4ACE0|nr:hypothetical protein [Humibacter albus]
MTATATTSLALTGYAGPTDTAWSVLELARYAIGGLAAHSSARRNRARRSRST